MSRYWEVPVVLRFRTEAEVLLTQDAVSYALQISEIKSLSGFTTGSITEILPLLKPMVLGSLTD